MSLDFIEAFSHPFIKGKFLVSLTIELCKVLSSSPEKLLLAKFHCLLVHISGCWALTLLLTL